MGLVERCLRYMPIPESTPVAILSLHTKTRGEAIPEPCEPIFGGYATARGEISLFGETLVYRVNFKNNTVRKRPPLNSGAQARYDATPAGERFEFCSAGFQRLSEDQIVEVCASGSFRIAQ